MPLNAKKWLVGMVATTMVLPTGIAHAAPEPTTHVQINSDKELFESSKASFDPSLARTEGLEALRELRGEMWDKNPAFRGYGYEGYDNDLRAAAFKEGIYTKAQYMDVTIDADYTWIAIQRAYEASEVFAHKRPDGSGIDTATIDGHGSKNESLAADVDSLSEAILKTWGESELKALKKNKGAWNSDNEHLIQLLHPKMRYYGFGAVEVRGSEYGTYYAAISEEKAAGEKADKDNTPEGEQTVTLHRAPTEKEAGKRAEAKAEKSDAANAEDKAQQNTEGASEDRPFVEVKKLEDIIQPRG
ncbi:hypothetical protein [Corynebacterium gerontici]|uniref:SCP domain-containing protein n=1 Tax=Corynebacterium gerontici TaxID=2079234 RepID=A0A3G6J5F5_9CORY|nr:hypothetical protein [Corynebacterium gerontici]AZA11650.1 hypothetical protein CGERO_06750 [Corynebacterium gerontici]